MKMLDSFNSEGFQRMYHRLALLPVGLLLMPTLSYGLGIRIGDQDPFATARGDAFVATADNPSAIYYNPAGLTQLSGHNARVGTYGISLQSEYKNAGMRFETEDQLAALPQFYYAYAPEKLPLAFGLGFFSPYGLSLEWPNNTPFRSLALEGEITYLTLNPVVAWQVHETLSIGAGPTLNYSDALLSRGLIPPPFNVGEFKFEGDDTALGFSAGLLWRPHPKHAFGFAYRSKTVLDYRGESTTRGGDLFGVPSGSQSARASFEFPQNIVVGYSFRPTTNWNFEFNADWTDWDSLNVVTLNQRTGNVPLVFNWQSSWFYEFGVTRYLPHGLAVSAGYIYSENSVPESSFNPVVPDSDRHIWSMGVGQRFDRWSWDFAYQFAYGPPRTINDAGLANGRYTFISHALTLAFGCQF